MRLLILGLNYAPERVGIAVYTTGMAEGLAAEGHEVLVIAGQPYYPAWRIVDGHRAWSFSTAEENGVAVTRVPHYIPAHPTGSRRLLHHASFAAAALFPALWSGLAWRPDVVLTVAPSLIAAPVARLAALVAGARSWLHIQDLEVEAAFATGLIAERSALGRLARGFETLVLRSFEQVSAISPEMCRRLTEKGVPRERVTELRNWADTEAIRPMTAPSPYREEWGIETEHVALYSGNIANKQGIDIVLDAARLLRHRDDLTFVICGEGPERGRLEAKAQGLDNVRLRNLQPKQRLNELMGLATIHILPQVAGAADLMLPSKLTNMLASGRPVVATAAAGTGLAREVERCGAVVAPEDTGAFADGIVELMEDRELYAACAAAARRRAEERWAKDLVLGSLAAMLREAGAVPAGSGTSVEQEI
ncbi:MAG: colanic acid biosynthesis glycosyltransferase WcaI [Devosia sp.]|uniref:WcaI family glycosyltransferase n=1 Tax=Devosia sp. TaxID=1871048 RepID=UPI00262DBF93|nr:WcaI family glycosyltransferase [Devosia sp.]MDB5539293.1 colanic acid biosynthesis glycosyltransferase WcaI [Devosia sp.]